MAPARPDPEPEAPLLGPLDPDSFEARALQQHPRPVLRHGGEQPAAKAVVAEAALRRAASELGRRGVDPLEIGQGELDDGVRAERVVQVGERGWELCRR